MWDVCEEDLICYIKIVRKMIFYIFMFKNLVMWLFLNLLKFIKFVNILIWEL